MISDVEKTIREYLPDILHMSLATSSNNKPWVCEVNIVKQHALSDKPRGVYFEGEAKILEDSEQIQSIVPLFIERLGSDASIAEEATTKKGHKIYKITVNNFYLFDSTESNPSQKYELKWNGGQK